MTSLKISRKSNAV